MVAHRLRDAMDLLRSTPFHPQWLLGKRETASERLLQLPAGRVLDIGCADRWVQPLLPLGSEYVALDYPATGAVLYDARPDVFADAARLPLADASVDTVLAFEVIEHLRHPREALREIARVLRPGGRLLLTVPFLYPVHDAPNDYQRYTEYGLAREIEAIGLTLEGCRPALGSAETAGLILCLALGGMAVQALNARSMAVLLLPIVAVVIPLINLSSWLLSKTMPSWAAVAAGYELTASKP